MTREHSIPLHSRPGVTYILRWDDAFQALVAIGHAEAMLLARFVAMTTKAEVAR